jgi:hypothetical protein
MDVIWFYVFAIIPFLVGGLMWATGKKVVWWEWIAGTVIGFTMAGAFHWMAMKGQTDDKETWSGQIVSGRHVARWQEYYEEAIYRTEYYTERESYTYYSGSGKNRSSHTGYRTVTKSRQVFDHWEGRRRWHDDTYSLESNISTSYSTDNADFYKKARSWDGAHPTPGRRTTGEHNSKMIGGDPNDYLIRNTGYVWPVTKLVTFENRIKATPTVFSYAKVPEGMKVFGYPANGNPFSSDRLVGSAAVIDLFQFDQMNARLGPTKKVNVILVGMGDRDSMSGQWQEAAWIGGKKNDVVICWGGVNTKPTWVRAFGWTESKLCLRNLETIVLENGVTVATLPAIEKEIKLNYVIKDWHKFDYIRVPAPMWSIVTYLCVALVCQALFWWWANANEFTKETIYAGLRPRYRY